MELYRWICVGGVGGVHSPECTRVCAKKDPSVPGAYFSTACAETYPRARRERMKTCEPEAKVT